MRIGTALLCLSCSAATVAAQEKKQSVEIGTSLGVTVLSQSGETFTTVGAPVAQGPVPLFGQATLYATIFATPSVMIEPQLSFSHLSGGGSSLTLIGGAANIGYLFTATERASPYVAASLGVESLSGDLGSASGVGLGGSVGYRLRAGAGFAVRFEGRYRHWLGDFDGLNEFGFVIGLGGII